MSLSVAPPRSDEPGFLAGGGNMGALIRAHDWASTPLGKPETWPAALRTLMGVMLGSGQPMFITWGPKRIMLYNDGYAPMLGQRHPSALGMAFEQVWFEILDSIGPVLDDAYNGISTHVDDMEFLMLRNGYAEETHFSFSYTPVRGDGDAIDGMFCACAEITAKVQAERALRESEARWRSLFDQAPSFMAMLTGPEHTFEYVNSGYMQLVGQRDVVGKPIREALPELEGQGYFELLDQIYIGGETHVGQTSAVALTRTPGSAPEQRFVDFVFQPLSDNGGKTTGIFVEGYDVTERVRSDLAAAESVAQFKIVAEAMPGFLWTAAPDGELDYISRGWMEYSGTTEEQSLGTGWANFIHPDDRQRASDAWAAAVASLDPYETEFRLRDSKGDYRAWLVKASPLRDNCGAVTRWIGTATSIHEIAEIRDALARSREELEQRVSDRTSQLRREMERRLEIEEALRQSQKMEAVGQLTGGIAHDFNNLLQGIVGSLEIIQKRVSQGRTNDLERFITGAMTSANRAAALTHRLLAFSRRQPLAPKTVDPNALLGSVEDLLHRTLGEQYQVKLELQSDIWRTLCDPNQLESAILNLSINARDAMPDGGTLTLSTRNIESADLQAVGLRDIEPGQYVCISVNDTGTGMTPDVIARAFDPFFTTKPLGQGTGLGLSMIYGFARQSDGYAKIFSEVGKGTCVRLYLPRNEGATEVDHHNEGLGDEHQAQQGEVVVVIEDEEVVRTMIVDVLNELGYTALEATDGPSGLQLLEGTGHVDLLITDIGLPGLNGRQVADAARLRRPRLKVLFMTGYAENAAASTGFLEHDMQLMTKPFPLEEMATRIRSMIGH